MQQEQERVNARLQAMDQELDRGSFNRNRMAQQSREIERAMNEWRNQYRKMSQEMGAKPKS
jgi:hypothetical protein